MLDAKYKRYAELELQKLDGDDLHQVITYMYILGAQYGGFIVPRQYGFDGLGSQPKTLKGYGGSMNIYGIIVDTPANDFKAYCQQMNHYEKEFVDMLPQKKVGQRTVP